MGELNLDNIDRALMKEHERYHDGCSLEKEVKAVENLRRRQSVPVHTVLTSTPYDMDARPEALLSITC